MHNEGEKMHLITFPVINFFFGAQEIENRATECLLYLTSSYSQNLENRVLEETL